MIIVAVGSARLHSRSSVAAPTWLLFVWQLNKDKTEGARRLLSPDAIRLKDPRLRSQSS